MDRRRGFETVEHVSSRFRLFRLIGRRRGATRMFSVQAYDCEHALKKFHYSQRRLPFRFMWEVVVIAESALPK